MPSRDSKPTFDPNCRACSRLSGHLREVRRAHPHYHCAPVAPFGDPGARLLVVGLAPGKHGANATGRPFTGDFAGILLYSTLHKFGFASRPASVSAADGLELRDCRITNAVKCLPPDNKPNNDEVVRCNVYLSAELEACGDDAVVLALGAIAHRAVLKALGLTQARFPFRHARQHDLPRLRLVDSYHCSRYNTQTGRLTPLMFEQVFRKIRTLLP